MSTYQLDIDGTPAESGAKRIVKSFDDIKAAANRMEKDATKSFSAMAKAFRELSAMGSVQKGTVDRFREFSAAISGFKGPSQANLANTKKFFEFLKGINGFKAPSVGGLKSFLDPLSNFKGPSAQSTANVRVLLKSVDSFTGVKGAGLGNFLREMENFKGPSAASAKNVRTLLQGLQGFTVPRTGNLANFLAILSSYKGPSQASSKNTASLLRALSGFTNAPRSTSSFNAFLTTLGSYKGPTATAGRNTLSLLNALATFTPPRNITNTITGFERLALAIDRAAGSMARLRQGASGTLPVPGGRNFEGASRGIQDLSRNYGFLETAVLRTTTTINALGSAFALKQIAEASIRVTQIRNQLEAATGSVAQGRVQFAFLRTETERLGLEFSTTARSYGMLLGSIKGTNVTFAEVQKIFLGFSTAARALHLSTDDVDGIFRALGQIMSKGKLQAEELRGQLGDRLPGAFVRFAKALDMTKPGQLDDALKKGAISGDKLKNAILEVSATLESEFASSADKASQSVEAAFNRLKNSFTFTSDEFGQSGFNKFLISLADGLRALMESTVVNKSLEILGSTLKVLGDNIEFVASLLVGVGVASLVRWGGTALTASAAMKTLNASMVTFRLAMAGDIAAQMAMGLGNIGPAATRAAVGVRGLTLALNANVFILAATAIAGVVYALSQLKTKNEEARAALEDTSKSIADGTNLVDAYIAKNLDISKVINQQTSDLNNNTLAVLQNTRAKAGDAELARVQRVKTIGGTDFVGFGVGNKRSFINGERVDPALGKLLDPLTQVGKGTGVNGLTGGETLRLKVPMTGKQFESFVANTANLKANVSLGGKFAAGGDTVTQAEALISSMVRESQVKGNTLGFNAAEIATRIGGDYNNDITPPGISGDAPAGKTKPPKGANQYRNSVQNAIDALRDLDVKAKATQDLITTVSKGSLDAVAASARAQAVSRVEDFEQAFKGENIKKRQQGIIDIANAMNLQATSYTDAKEKLISYYAAAEEKQTRLDNDRKTQDNIINLKQENEIRERYVDAIRLGGDALAQANIQMEVEKQLLNGSAENREALTQQLTEQLQEQLKLNRAEKAAQMMQDYSRTARVNSQIAQTYGMGYNADDLADAQQLIKKHDELVDAYGQNSPFVNFFMDLERAALANEQALKRAAQQYEEIQNLSEDVAGALTDAFADAFKNGYREGETFKSRLKNLFKELKDIFLDFVLFNPLKQFLTESLTGTFSRQYANSTASAAVSSSSANITDRAYSGIDLLSSILSPNARSTDMNAVTSSERQQSVATLGQTLGATVGDAIIVQGNRPTSPNMIPEKQTPQFFSSLKKVFDFKSNQTALKEGFSELKSVFGGGKGLGGKLDSLGKGLGSIGKAAGSAFAAYGAGSGVASMLGLGKGGQKIAGFASAGFSLGGPIGAAIGAAIGTGFAIFGKKKVPSAWGSVSVNEAGQTSVSAGKYGSGSRIEGAAMGEAGASVFRQFSYGYGADLVAGSYGAFGKRKIKNDGVKGESYFYSTEGVSGKGKPIGTKGVDWISSEDQSVVQAFALIKQIQSGKFTGLDSVYKTIANNTATGSTLETLQSNLSVGTSYLDFIDAAKIQTDTQKQMNDLAKSFKSLSAQSKQLGLDTNRLDAAYSKLKNTYRDNFNFDIDQQILELTDPLKAAYNSLVKEYEDSVADAIAVGGDLTAVEKLYGLKRAELAKQYAEESLSSYAAMAKDLLTQLTASPSSPLSSLDVLNNSRKEYETLRSEILGGDYTNAGKLQDYASNYLDAARATGKSSYDYFSVFDEVTEFLKLVQNSEGSPTNADNLAQLPGLQTIIDKLNTQNNDLLETTKDVGAAISEGNSSNEAIGNKTNSLLQELLDQSKSELVNNTAGVLLKSSRKV